MDCVEIETAQPINGFHHKKNNLQVIHEKDVQSKKLTIHAILATVMDFVRMETTEQTCGLYVKRK